MTHAEIQKFKDRAFERKRGAYPNYVRLFDLVKAQAEFDEVGLVETLKKRGQEKNLHRQKNYLYHRILKYIRESNLGEESELFGCLEKIKILYQKRLFHHLGEFIPKAKRLAVEMEDFASHRKVIDFEKNLLKYTRNWPNYSKKIRLLIEEEDAIWEKESNLREMKKIEDELFQVIAMPLAEKEKFVAQLLTNKLLASPDRALSINALISQKKIFAWCHFETEELQKLQLRAIDIVETFKMKAGLIASNSNFVSFVNETYKAAAYHVILNEFPEAEAMFENLRSFANADKRMPVLYFERSTIFELILARKQGDYERGANAIRNFESNRESLEPNFDPASLTEINHLAAIFLLNNGEPKYALRFILENKGRNPKYFKPEFVHFAKILFLVAHYELGNMDVISAGLGPARMSFKKHQRSNEFTVSVFDFFGRLASSPFQEHSRCFAEFEALIHSKKDFSPWKRMNYFFNLRAWVRAKIEGKKMIEILLRDYFIHPGPY